MISCLKLNFIPVVVKLDKRAAFLDVDDACQVALTRYQGFYLIITIFLQNCDGFTNVLSVGLEPPEKNQVNA